MKIINIAIGTEPSLFHAPGPKNNHREYRRQNPFWPILTTHLFATNATSQPPPLAIFTCNNQPTKGNLELSLDRLGWNYTTLGSKVQKWSNIIKISLFLEALQNSNDDLILLADSSDVVITGCIQETINYFIATESQALFNAERTFWPKFGGICLNWEASEAACCDGPYKALNAGVVLGRRTFLLEYYKCLEKLNVAEVIDQMPNADRPAKHILDSEQIRHHLAFEKFKQDIVLDSFAQSFQVITHHSPSEFSFGPTFL